RHTRFSRDWSSDVCSSDLQALNFSMSNSSPPSFNKETSTWMGIVSNNILSCISFNNVSLDFNELALNVLNPSKKSFKFKSGKFIFNHSKNFVFSSSISINLFSLKLLEINLLGYFLNLL